MDYKTIGVIATVVMVLFVIMIYWMRKKTVIIVVPSGGAVLPQGTILPQGAVLPQGTVLPAGTVIPSGGAVLPQGTVLPDGALIPSFLPNEDSFDGQVMPSNQSSPYGCMCKNGTAPLPCGKDASGRNIPVICTGTEPICANSSPVKCADGSTATVFFAPRRR
jgi:hypothetical protein